MNSRNRCRCCLPGELKGTAAVTSIHHTRAMDEAAGAGRCMWRRQGSCCLAIERAGATSLCKSRYLCQFLVREHLRAERMHPRSPSAVRSLRVEGPCSRFTARLLAPTSTPYRMCRSSPPCQQRQRQDAQDNLIVSGVSTSKMARHLTQNAFSHQYRSTGR